MPSKKLFIANEDADKNIFSNCPNIPQYKPKGYKENQVYFVDKSGFGRDDELALTPSRFLSMVKKGMGYAITEEGQFQVYITEYKKV